METNTKHILELTKQIITQYEEISSLQGENFNLFKVINLTTDEVRIHSTFLAELLNPNGSHGQKEKFLEIFVKKLNIENFNFKKAKVFVEKYIGVKTIDKGGRIDILIIDNNKKTIIIENKIYAKDQENQLVRYFNYSKDNLLYLTLFGEDPSKESCNKLIKGKDFQTVSYSNDIINWLEECKKETVNLPLLREGVTHYINLIKHLTGRSNSLDMENKIATLIGKSSKNIKSAIAIKNSLEQAKINIQFNFWENLQLKFEQVGLKLNESKVSLQNVRNFYTKSKNNKYFGLWSKIYSNENITIHFGIEIDHNIYFGFTIEKDEKGGISELEEFNEIRRFISDMDTNYTYSKYWLGWKHTKPKLNFREFSSDEVINLSDNDYLKETVKSIVEEAMEDIKAVQKKLKTITMI